MEKKGWGWCLVNLIIEHEPKLWEKINFIYIWRYAESFLFIFAFKALCILIYGDLWGNFAAVYDAVMDDSLYDLWTVSLGTF